MFRSLRFQLPALFLVGVIVFGLVAAAIAFQLLAVVHAQPRAGRPAARGARDHAPLHQAGERVERPGSGAAARGGDRRPHLLRAARSGLRPLSRERGPQLRQLPKKRDRLRAPSPAAGRCSSSSSCRARTRRGSRSRGRSTSARAATVRRARSSSRSRRTSSRRASCRCSGGSRSRCSAASSSR